MKRRPFLTPAYVLAAIGIVQIGFSFGIYRRILGNMWSWQLALSFASFPILYLIEAWLYYWIRNRRYQRKWAYWHLGILLVQRVFFNIFLIGVVSYLSGGITAGFGMAIPYLNWISILVSHVFFVMVLVDAFKKRPDLSSDDPDSPHLLDEILDDPTVNLE